MEVGVEQDEVPPREALLEDVGDAPKEGDLDTRVEDSSAIPNNNHIAQPNVASSALDQDEFPTLTAAASIRKSRRERRQQRPPIPAKFRVGGSLQGISTPVSLSPIVPAVSASNRLWADVARPASPDLPTLDSSPETTNVEELGIQPLPPVSTPTSSDPVPLLPEKFVVSPPSPGNNSASDSASKRTICNWPPSSGSYGHERSHSAPSRYPDEIGRHTRQSSLTDRPQTTNTITHSPGVPAILNRSCESSPNHSANRLFSSTSKKSLNVDSPSFTPAQLGGVKKSNFSTNATPFTPRAAAASANPPLQQDPGASLFKSSPFPEFAPQNNYDLNTVVC
ncbi:hypothetical protein F4809DRAFT_24825 [Biscogniauxia mediterranea]|nr:hypothetical protein F4809DRAFT_24825 [Biscogniauxia mediterranea]